MANKVVQGEDITILIDGKAAMHATSHTLEVTLDTKEIQTKDTDGKEIAPGVVSFTVQGEGLVVIDPELSERQDPTEILDMLLEKRTVEIITKSAIHATMKQYTGKALVTSFSKSSPAGDNATYSYTLTGSGTLKPYVPNQQG